MQRDAVQTKARRGATHDGLSLDNQSRQRPTLPHTCACSTIGGGRLNYRVRNGNGCDPAPMTTGKLDGEPASRNAAEAFRQTLSRFANTGAWGPVMWSAAFRHASSHQRSSQTMSKNGVGSNFRLARLEITPDPFAN